jgi:hypothetical protein
MNNIEKLNNKELTSELSQENLLYDTKGTKIIEVHKIEENKKGKREFDKGEELKILINGENVSIDFRNAFNMEDLLKIIEIVKLKSDVELFCNPKEKIKREKKNLIKIY